MTHLELASLSHKSRRNDMAVTSESTTIIVVLYSVGQLCRPSNGLFARQASQRPARVALISVRANGHSCCLRFSSHSCASIERNHERNQRLPPLRSSSPLFQNQFVLIR
jgi:hypothetical protein